MSSSPAIFVRPLCLQIFLGGVVLEYINLIQAVDLNDELILRQNNLLERLSTQLSNIPTKDDLASLEAKFERGIERERRQNGDLKTKLQIMSNAMTKKLDGLQNTIDNFRGLVKFMVEECINSCLENKPRSKRSTPNLPNAVKTELDFRNLSDYRLVLLTTQWLQVGKVIHSKRISTQLALLLIWTLTCTISSGLSITLGITVALCFAERIQQLYGSARNRGETPA
ncbi:uncharacterized protein LOC110856169 isoform X2 [Folsomia candida]|uniref:uncharacterized protein LOC110856169 isoform X2 n=1 Tax=Folsomia candida TaxID=158441 RepID=UPI0016054F5A|nr:uncharacterized protein LOC110856169 isoform X2 [Folsomia candida]